MVKEYNVDKALKDLEGGKFSFQMVDCINRHLQTQQEELEVLESFKAGATTELAKYELKISRLERDLKIVNGAILRLIKTNALLEEGIAATKYGVVKFGEVAVPKIQLAAVEARPYAIEALKYTWTAVLKAAEAAEPHVKAWWGSIEPRPKKFTKGLSSSSPKGQN
jgi:hypothetical protein